MHPKRVLPISCSRTKHLESMIIRHPTRQSSFRLKTSIKVTYLWSGIFDRQSTSFANATLEVAAHHAKVPRVFLRHVRTFANALGFMVVMVHFTRKYIFALVFGARCLIHDEITKKLTSPPIMSVRRVCATHQNETPKKK